MAEHAVVEKTPLWFILFSISSGLLITLSFPFDIFALNFQNGIVLNSTTLPTIIEQFNGNFTPFIMVKHLGDAPIPYAGLVEIILLGFVIGTLVYLFSPVYETINHVVAVYISKNPYARFIKIVSSPDAHEELVEPAQVPKFIEWLKDTNTANYADFINSMAKLAQGLFFGAETFFLLNIIRILSGGIRYGIPQYFYGTPVGLSNSIESMAWWFVLSLLLGVISYILYRINHDNVMRTFRKWVKDFNEVKRASAREKRENKRRPHAPKTPPTPTNHPQKTNDAYDNQITQPNDAKEQTQYDNPAHEHETKATEKALRRS